MVAHVRIEFALLGTVVQEVFVQGDFSGFEKRDGAGAAEPEITFLAALGRGLIGDGGLDDAADIRGADFNLQNLAEICGADDGDDAFVLPDIT